MPINNGITAGIAAWHLVQECLSEEAASMPGGGYFLIPYGGIGLGIYSLQRPVLISSDSKRSLTLWDLMTQAGALDDHDREGAIRLYEEIVRRYPDTTQGREASRNLAVLLKRPHQPTSL